MHRFYTLWVLGMFALGAAASQAPSNKLLAADSSEIQYQVLSPWAEADPKPLRGISSRVDNLSGKKIGLFANYKRAALPIARSLQTRLKAMYSDSTVSIYHSADWNVVEAETENGDKFTRWAKEMDAVILLVGD